MLGNKIVYYNLQNYFTPKHLEMSKSILYFFLISILICYGCGYKTIILDTSNEKKEILLVGDSGFTSLSGMQIDAIQKAKNICAKDDKKYQIINKRVQPQGFAVWPEVNIFFKCE